MAGDINSLNLLVSILFLLCFRERLFFMPCGHLLGKGLTSWLSFVMSNCEVVTFLLEFWIRCGSSLYPFNKTLRS